MSEEIRCLKCNLLLDGSLPDTCPICDAVVFVCPWCGRMTDSSSRLCTAEGCAQPIKYVHVPPDQRDVMRLQPNKVVTIDKVAVVIEKALYASKCSTVYRARVSDIHGNKKAGPTVGSTVVVREVVGEWTQASEALVNKLIGLRHPNVVRTYAGQNYPESSCHRLLQAWIGERSLANAYLQEHGGQAASHAELGNIAVTLARAVEYVHSHGIIHCDVTPFNVLLTDRAVPVLSDFGIAVNADDPGQPRGYTPSYAPIELCPDWEFPSDVPKPNFSIGNHTDRYMLGATLFSIACGYDGRTQHPLTRECVLVPSVERARYDADMGGMPQTALRAFKRDVSPEFSACVEKLLSQAPEARFKSDSEMVKKIKAASRRLGKRRRHLPVRLQRLRKPAKILGVAVAAYALVVIVSHPYTLFHSPSNLPTFAMADVARLTGRPEAVLDALRGAPTPSPEVQYARGKALERMGRLDEAMEEYKRSLSLDPQYAASQDASDRVRIARGTASLQAGLQLYQLGEQYRAYGELSDAVHYGMCSEKGYRALADISVRRGQPAKAADYWDAVCKLNPSAVKPHYRAALLYLDSGSLEKAYHHAAKARDLQFKPEPQQSISKEDMHDLLNEVSATCLRVGRLDLAATTSTRRIFEKMVWLTRANNILPSASTYAAQGRYFERLGDLSSGDRKANLYDQAVENLQRARTLANASPTINNDLARCIIKRKRAQH